MAGPRWRGEDRRIAAGQSVRVQPGFELFRRVGICDPVRQRPAAAILLCEIQERLQPALLGLGEVQIGKARKLRPCCLHRLPAALVNQIKGCGEAGAVLAAGAFEQEGPGGGVECLDQPRQHGLRRQLAGIQHGVEMGDAGGFADGGFFFPPRHIVIAAAQVDNGADAPSLQKRSQSPGPGLHRPRRVPRHHPVEIVENVANCSGRGASHRMELAYFGPAMRITKQILARRWAVTTVSAGCVFAVLAWSDLRLKALSGFGTADLQGFSTAAEYRQAFLVWPSLYAVRAGFNWGLDYLLMPLYAAAFFYSGIIAREAFAPRPGRARRILTLLAAVPIAGAVLDAAENGLELGMMLSGASDRMARIAFTVSNAKWMALMVGLALLLGAVLAQVP